MTLDKTIKLAKELTVWEPLREAVIVFWDQKGKGGYRPISVFGPMRTAQCLMVRDMLSMMDIDNDFDFTRGGTGGEKQLVRNVCNDIQHDITGGGPRTSRTASDPSNQATSDGCRSTDGCS